MMHWQSGDHRYKVRYCKDHSDPDSKEGWRVFVDGHTNWNEIFETEDQAARSATNECALELRDRIARNLPWDIERLRAVVELIEKWNLAEIRAAFKLVEKQE